jgi:hypothetical protein
MLHHPKVRIVLVLAAVLSGPLAIPPSVLAGTLTLRGPASQAVIALRNPREAVLAFSWDNAPGVSTYRFRLATTAGLNRPIVQRIVADSSLSVRGLGPGTS